MKEVSDKSIKTEKTVLPTNNNDNNKNTKKGNKATIIISVILAAVVLCVFLYKYNDAKTDKELEEYEIAMKSDDPMILQTYLDNYKDAPQAHIDSVSTHLERINKREKDWHNALMNKSRIALTDYLSAYPNSPHEQEAREKLDSIDWAQCQKDNTIEALQAYLDQHPDGNHYDEAESAIKKVKAESVSVDERGMLRSLFRNFFLSINAKDAAALTNTVADITNFLGKFGATKNDVVTFMNKLYKPDVRNMTWSIDDNYNISKKEIGDEEYEYSVSFVARQRTEKTDNSVIENTYRINAKVGPEGKISDFSMARLTNE
ncbi:MAG: tol-pal system YbgF family protein [Prevotella sp.]